MKKKIAMLCLAVFVFCLLPGCSADLSETTRDTTGIAETKHPSEVLNVPNQKDIYFATGNDYYDLYCGYSWVPGPEITLLTREYIDPESIQVSVDIQADYSVYVHEQERGAGSLITYEVVESEGKREVNEITRGDNAFPLYLYQSYYGIDWVEVGKTYAVYLDLYEKQETAEIGAEQVASARDRYNYAVTEHINEYSCLNASDLPRYFEYLIQIKISNAEVEETLTTVQVTVGDAVYDVNIGEVIIRPFFELSTGYDGYNYLSIKTSPPLWLSCYPYGNGIEECRTEIFYAEQALTLTGLHFLDNTTSSLTVLDVIAFISDDPDSGIGIEVEWDGESPIYIEQGKHVTLYITVQDDRMKEINYHSKLYPVWEFECNGAAYEVVSEVLAYRFFTDKWLQYAIGMDGLDMESYFNDYYYLQPANNWRNDVDLTPWGQ